MKKYILILAVVSLLADSCVKEIPVGFLSPTAIRLRTDTLDVVRGVYTISDIPMVDGSTRPLNFELLGIKKLPSGEPATEFSNIYDVKLWSSPYNPDTDFTMEDVNKKIVVQPMEALTNNPVSGQLVFNGGTASIEKGLYRVDVRVSNVAGSRDIENFGVIRLVDRPWEAVYAFSESFRGIEAKGTEITLNTELSAEDMIRVGNNTHPNYSIERLGDLDGVRVKLTLMDANGDVYHGSVISKWATGTTYYNSWFDNSLDTKVLDDGVEFNFPTVPYPAFGRYYTSGTNLNLSYYVLPPNSYTLTPEAQAELDNKAKEQGTAFIGSVVGVRIAYKINQTGIWHVKVKLNKSIKK